MNTKTKTTKTTNPLATSKIKLTRNELLDAVADKVCLDLKSHAEVLCNKTKKLQGEIRDLGLKRDDKRLGLDKFNQVAAEVEAAANAVLKKHGCQEIKVTPRGHRVNNTPESPIKARLEFTDSYSKEYKSKSTKVLDAKIEKMEAEYQELHREANAACQTGYRWERSGTASERSDRRSAIVQKLMEKDDNSLEIIAQAAKHISTELTGDDLLNE